MGHPSRPMLKRYWSRRNDYATRAREQGIVLIRYVSSRMHVVAPYTDEFVIQAHRLGGRWRKRSGVWSFPEPVHKLVIYHLKRIYGEGNINKDVAEPLKDYGE